MDGNAGALAKLRGKSLLIFDDGLLTRDGHWLDHDKAVAAVHAQFGVATTVVCDRAFPHRKELEALGVTVLPLIEHSPWRDIAAGRSANGLVRSLALGWHFRGLLKRLLGEQPYDCVLHPAAMSSHLMAWCLLPRRLRRRSGRTMFATWVTLASYGADGAPRFARRLLYWRAMGAWLGSHFRSGHFAWGTDSERLAHEYRVLGNLPARPIPSPGNAIEDVAPGPAPGAPVCFGSLGPARMEKGIDLLQQAIALALRSDRADRMRFVIQWNRPVTDATGAPVLPDPALLADPRVRFITAAMTSDEYRKLLAATDCLVLPYRRSAYFSRGSGVAVEAACAAIPMIYTADTWLDDYVAREGAGIAVPDGDAPALAAAFAGMVDHYPVQKANAVARSALARDSNSAEGYALALWGNRL